MSFSPFHLLTLLFFALRLPHGYGKMPRNAVPRAAHHNAAETSRSNTWIQTSSQMSEPIAH